MSYPYDDLASAILFVGMPDPAKFGLQYRKGKDISDVKSAVERASKASLRAEFRLSMLSCYLGNVFKQERK